MFNEVWNLLAVFLAFFFYSFDIWSAICTERTFNLLETASLSKVEIRGSMRFPIPYEKNTLEFNGSIQLMIHWQSIDHQLTLGWIFHMQMRERSTHLHTVEISWPLLNAPLFSVQLTIVEYSFIFRAVDHCWTLLCFLCSWPLLNAHIFSVRLTTVESSCIFFVCIIW